MLSPKLAPPSFSLSSFSFPSPWVGSGFRGRFLPKPVINRWPRRPGRYMGQMMDKRGWSKAPIFSREREGVCTTGMGQNAHSSTINEVQAGHNPKVWQQQNRRDCGEFIQRNCHRTLKTNKVLPHAPSCNLTGKRVSGKKPDITAHAVRLHVNEAQKQAKISSRVTCGWGGGDDRSKGSLLGARKPFLSALGAYTTNSLSWTLRFAPFTVMSITSQ